MKLQAKDLKLADVVRLGWSDGYDTATVKQIADGKVTFFRPYTSTADFSYTGGVICYIGTEEFKVPVSSQTEYEVLRRQELK